MARSPYYCYDRSVRVKPVRGAKRPSYVRGWRRLDKDSRPGRTEYGAVDLANSSRATRDESSASKLLADLKRYIVLRTDEAD